MRHRASHRPRVFRSSPVIKELQRAGAEEGGREPEPKRVAPNLLDYEIVRASNTPIMQARFGTSRAKGGIWVEVTTPQRHSVAPRALHPRFEPLQPRFETLQPRFEPLNSRFEPLNSRFEPLNSRLEPLNSRLGCLNSRFETLHSRFETLHSRFEPLNSRLEPLKPRFEPLNSWFEPLHSRFECLISRLESPYSRFEWLDAWALKPSTPVGSRISEPVPGSTRARLHLRRPPSASSAGRRHRIALPCPPAGRTLIRQSRRLSNPRPPPPLSPGLPWTLISAA